MKAMNLGRYATLAICVLILLFEIAFIWDHHVFWHQAIAVVAVFFTVVGIHDLFQPHHSILRNYPVLGHVRWLAELIRPEIRQYLIEADEDAAPFSRVQRSVVYARAKNQGAERAFGTLLDVYQDGYEFIGHATCPVDHADPSSFRITIGGDQCAQPYSASVFNISAMSFGSLGAAAIRALNKGAKLGGFYHDTGEGSISRYHREFGGDIVWEVASGYFGCRTAEGRFDPDRFAAQARNDQVKMIEIKLSQGAKPGHGGILPAEKVTPEISEARGVPMGVDCVSPARHSSFSTPLELMAFIARLRELSGGKPVGFKLCLGHAWEFMAIVKAMLETGVRPDFIVVDGGEGGTGAAPRWNSPTTWARPCARASCWCTTPWWARACATRFASAWRARSSPPSTSPASWPSARTGPTPRAASCSPWAACSRSIATPTAARPASPPRTPRASARWWWRTKPSGSITFTATP